MRSHEHGPHKDASAHKSSQGYINGHKHSHVVDSFKMRLPDSLLCAYGRDCMPLTC